MNPERLIDEHLPELYRLAWALTGNEADAQDLAHDAMLSALGALGRFRGASRVSTWLTAILVNRHRFSTMFSTDGATSWHREWPTLGTSGKRDAPVVGVSPRGHLLAAFLVDVDDGQTPHPDGEWRRAYVLFRRLDPEGSRNRSDASSRPVAEWWDPDQK